MQLECHEIVAQKCESVYLLMYIPQVLGSSLIKVFGVNVVEKIPQIQFNFRSYWQPLNNYFFKIFRRSQAYKVFCQNTQLKFQQQSPYIILRDSPGLYSFIVKTPFPVLRQNKSQVNQTKTSNSSVSISAGKVNRSKEM